MKMKQNQEIKLLPFYENATKIDLSASIHSIEHHPIHFIIFKLQDPEESVSFELPQDHSSSKNQRIIGLWNKTCFEIFIQFKNKKYIEGNFNHLFQWNFFEFDSYRFPETKEIQIKNQQSPVRDVLFSNNETTIIVQLPDEIKQRIQNEGIEKLGLTSILKLKNQETLYYALKHADSKPNFHHFESFLEIEELTY